MLYMERELHSEFEGAGWPLFQILPKGKSFWFVRVVLEPALVLIAGIVLQDLFIAQPDLAIYLNLAALALFVKNFISWFRAWEYLRKLFDMRNAGPLIAKLVDSKASAILILGAVVGSGCLTMSKSMKPSSTTVPIEPISSDSSG